MHNLARPTSRPLRLLSDMQAMMEETQAFENRVLERLNAGKTVRSFLIATVELLTEAVNILVLQVFRTERSPSGPLPSSKGSTAYFTA